MARIRNRRLLADASNGKSRLQRWLAHCGIASGALAPSSRLRPPRRRTCGRSSIAEAAASRRKLSHRLRTTSSPDRWHDSEPSFDPRQAPVRPPFAHIKTAAQRSDGLSFCGERHHSFATTPSAWPCRAWVQLRVLLRAFSGLASETSNPLYLAFHLWNVALGIRCLVADISGRRTRPHLVGNPYYLPKRLLIRQNGFGIPKQLICIWLYSSLIGYEPLTSPGRK